MRLIDGGKLIEKIEEWQSELTRKDAEESAIDDALEWINDRIAEADALEWIPVSEGLPEDGEAVLVTEDWEGVEPFAETAVHAVGMFSVDNIDVSEHVTAWMRLPEPWEGEE